MKGRGCGKPVEAFLRLKGRVGRHREKVGHIFREVIGREWCVCAQPRQGQCEMTRQNHLSSKSAARVRFCPHKTEPRPVGLVATEQTLTSRLDKPQSQTQITLWSSLHSFQKPYQFEL
ncbi:hypothetical protein RRG08_014344 [Elysia crispata]|uniref:Uncharacterized protein n=1 Tax=Elysia crispata TaxID=231223 RepID=A0AAE0XNG7_9GAST|nr:hypothetical protein RRG08_014344 [Elysia crispata]